MTNSSATPQSGVVRSAAVISLELVALAGSIAASLYRRMTAPAASTTKISKLVMDEWEADLARLNLPSRSEVEALLRQLDELEAQIDQIIQQSTLPKEGD